jgi:DNA invertase Pin-like site-specific DNA recombinase
VLTLSVEVSAMDMQSLLDQMTRCAYDEGADAVVARYADQLARWDGEPAGIWVRVSSGGQDEANQIPDVLRHCISQGYRPAKWYMLHDKSAYKGEQQAKLDEMIDDMRHGMFKVLVCWHSDRIERRGDAYLQMTLLAVHDAAGHIEATKEPLFDKEGIEGELATSFSGIMSHRYSVEISRKVKLGQDRIRANDAVITMLPWGYSSDGPKYNKTAVPTDVCREYWPQVLTRCLTDSCRAICTWLDSEGIETDSGKSWNEGVLRRLIRNPVYCGRRLGWADNKPLLKSEAVVSLDLWVRANEALSNRPKRGPNTGRVNAVKPMLAKLLCLRCGSPMYRIHAGSRDRENFYYRCAGKGPQRKGCGNMVPYGRLERMIAVRFLAWNDKPYQIREWVEGQTWDAEISDIRKVIRELDPESEEDEARRDVLKAQLSDYRSRETTPGHWEYTDARNADSSIFTIGQHFFDLDAEGRREYLTTHDIRAERAACCGGIRVVIDGREDAAHKDGCPMAESDNP